MTLNEAVNVGSMLALVGAVVYFSILRYTTWFGE